MRDDDDAADLGVPFAAPSDSGVADRELTEFRSSRVAGDSWGAR